MKSIIYSSIKLFSIIALFLNITSCKESKLRYGLETHEGAYFSMLLTKALLSKNGFRMSHKVSNNTSH